MLATLIIVFREAMEAGLIVGIVLAATVGLPGRLRAVALGVCAGVAGACLAAAFAGAIADAFEGSGQEIMNAAILAFAVVMLAWHVVWMSRHGRHMARDLRAAGAEARAGRRTMSALGLVVGVAVLRESVEVVLFLYGIAVTDAGGWKAMLVGGLGGLGLAAALSWATYAGLVRLPAHRLFAVTGWLVTLLACGLASQSAAFLRDGGVVTVLAGTVWDTSALVPSGGLPGRVLHTLIGYVDRPSALEVVVYGATLAGISLLAAVERRSADPRAARSVARVRDPAEEELTPACAPAPRAPR